MADGIKVANHMALKTGILTWAVWTDPMSSQQFLKVEEGGGLPIYRIFRK